MHIFYKCLGGKKKVKNVRIFPTGKKELLLTTAQQNLPASEDAINVKKVKFSSCRCRSSTAIIIINYALMAKADRQPLPCMFTANILLLKRRCPSRLLRMALTFQGNILWKMVSLLWCLLKVTKTVCIYWIEVFVFDLLYFTFTPDFKAFYENCFAWGDWKLGGNKLIWNDLIWAFIRSRKGGPNGKI